MLFSWRITVAKGYPTTPKASTDLRIARGIITRIEVQFPKGCAGLVHAQICHGLHQIFPKNADQDIASNGETVSSMESLEILTPPYLLKAWTWNTSTLFDHIICVRVEVLPKRGFLGGVLGRR